MWLSAAEQRTWRAMLSMTSRLDAALNRQLQRDSGLSLADYDVLVAVGEALGRRLRMFELGEQLHWEQSRLSHQLARMQRRGLVAREPSADDGRGSDVALTDAGRAALAQAAPAHAETVRELVFDGLTARQLAGLETTLRRILRRLDAAEDQQAAQANQPR